MKVFTGSAPFDLHLSITVALAILQGERPSRPPHRDLTDNLWEVMQHCWNQEPSERPDMSEVLRVLRSPLAPLSFHNRVFVGLIGLLYAVKPLGSLPTTGHFPYPPPRRPKAVIRGGTAGAEDELYPSRPDPIPWLYDNSLAPTGLRSGTINAATCRTPKSINSASRNLKTAIERLNPDPTLQ